jgi:hypothetical protein
MILETSDICNQRENVVRKFCYGCPTSKVLPKSDALATPKNLGGESREVSHAGSTDRGINPAQPFIDRE